MAIRKGKSMGKSATGAAVLDLALRLKKKNPNLSLEEAKDKAREKIEMEASYEKTQAKLREKLEVGSGGKAKRAIFRGLLGHKLGDKVSGLIRSKSTDEQIATKLISNEKEFQEKYGERKEKKDPSERTNDTNSMILKRLASIETIVKSLKAEKVSAPKAEAKNPHHQDAAAALMALGYKKNEVEEMLKGAQGSDVQSLIKDALKPKNHEAVPIAQVPNAVAAVDPSTPMAVPSAQVPNAVDPSTPMAVPSAQEEAAGAKSEQQQREAAEGEEKRQKETKAELDDIKKHVDAQKGGILSSLMGMLGKFLGPVLGLLPLIGTALTAIAPLLGGLVAIAGAAYAGYKIGQWLNNKFKIAEKIDDVIGPKYDPNKGGAHANTLKEVAAVNKKLEGSGYTALGAGQYKDTSGHVVKHDALPASVRAKLGEGAATTTTAAPSPMAVASQAPVAAAAAAARVDSASSDNAGMKAAAAAPVVNLTKNDNRQIIAPSKSSSSQGTIMVAVRNMEPSVGAYVASIFNHPVLRLPM